MAVKQQIENSPACDRISVKPAVRFSDMSDEALVGLVQKQSEAAFAELVKRYMKKSFGIAYNIVGDYETARDLSQDVFVKIYRSINKFKQGNKFFSWYYRILINHCINYTRRNKILAILPYREAFPEENDIPDTSNSGEDAVDASSEKQYIVRSAIKKLSNKHKQVVILCELEELSQNEAAEILGISIGTVRSRLHYARKQLKKILKSVSNMKEDSQ